MLGRTYKWAVLAAAVIGAYLGAATLYASEAQTEPAPVASAATAAPVPPPEEVLVRFRTGAGASERAAARRAADTEFEETLPLSGLQLVKPEPGASATASAARLERSDAVLYAEPNYARSATVTPNDPYFDLLWGLHNSGQTVADQRGVVDADVDGPEAWDLTTGSAGITVGVIDSGVDYDHPDLSPNVWRNPGETGGGRDSNGVDDDGNGLIDDWRGWDWVERDNAPMDQNGHGTHVAGTIGARGNDGVGVAGVAWQGSLLPLRVLDADGSGRVSDVISAYVYAGRKQIRVMNASLGGGGSSQAEQDAIRAAPDTLFVVAAGNDGADNDSTGSYPCNYELPNIVCVAASDRNDALAGFSNFGGGTVDLAAPGVNIASTWPGGRWAYLSGTSMATPHVAGAAALAWAREPGASVATIRTALLRNVDPVGSLAGRTVTGGRLNARRAVADASASSTPEAILSDGPQPATPAPEPAPAISADPAPTLAPPVTGSASDSTPPRVSVTLRAGMRLRGALRSGFRVRTGCSEACTVRHEVVLARGTAKRLSLGSGSRAVIVASGRGGVGRAGSSVARVRFTRSARRRLAQIRSTRLELRVRVADRAGNLRSVRRVLRLGS